VLDATVAILVIGKSALLSEALAALMAYKRFLARVDARVIIDIALTIGGVIASIASVLLLPIHRPLSFLIAFEDEHGRRMDHDVL